MCVYNYIVILFREKIVIGRYSCILGVNGSEMTDESSRGMILILYTLIEKKTVKENQVIVITCATIQRVISYLQNQGRQSF